MLDGRAVIIASIAVKPEANLDRAAYAALLDAAHLQRLHLARPIQPKITRRTHVVHALATAMGLAIEDHDYYLIQAETVPCPAT